MVGVGRAKFPNGSATVMPDARPSCNDSINEVTRSKLSLGDDDDDDDDESRR